MKTPTTTTTTTIPDLVQRLDAARSVLYAGTLADRDGHSGEPQRTTKETNAAQ
jgi:hypothetical protein